MGRRNEAKTGPTTYENALVRINDAQREKEVSPACQRCISCTWTRDEYLKTRYWCLHPGPCLPVGFGGELLSRAIDDMPPNEKALRGLV
jgi:hypothetical protein